MIMPTLLLSALLGAGPAIFALEARNNVWDVTDEDFSGNGFKDLLVLSCDEKSDPLEKYLELFAADDDARYAGEALHALRLAPSVGAVFLAQVTGDGPREVVAADAAGATVYRFDPGAGFVEHARADFPSLLPSNAREPIFLRHAAQDLTGDGLDEWIIPMPTGFQVRNADGLVADVASDVISEIRRGDGAYIYHRLPAVETFVLPDSPQKGLAFLSDEFADFAHGPDWREQTRFRIPVDLEEKWEAAAKMGDINGNGFPDLVVTQTRGTVRLEAMTQVYLSEAPFTYPEEPTFSFTAQGAISTPGLMDIDGDGYKDLVVISIPFGVRNIVNFFVRGRLTVNAEVYLFNGTGFDDSPDYSTNLSLEAPEGREQIAHVMADFTGDGRMDLAFGAGRDELAIHTGDPERFISRRPWLELDVPAFGIARAADLNGNPAQDIMLFHPASDQSQTVHVILF